MACACNKNKTRHQVVKDGKTLYSSTSKGAADQVARRYPGSTVEEVAPKTPASGARVTISKPTTGNPKTAPEAAV